MIRSIKTRLTLGVGIQFLLVALTVIAGILAVNLLTADTRDILRDNYDTLGYCRHISTALDDLENPIAAKQVFRENLDKQQANVTEEGEQQLTELLAKQYDEFAANPSDRDLHARIRVTLDAISELNMEAIQRKSGVAVASGRTSNIIIGTVGTLSFVIAFTMLLNLPSSVAEPIRTFTESLRQIASGNYASRVDEKRTDEFGEMALTFNRMAARLEQYESSQIARMLSDKKRLEATINQMQNPIIGLNEEGTILFANDAAVKILGLSAHELAGKAVADVAKRNDLLRNLTDGHTESKAEPKQLRIYADGKESYFQIERVRVTVPLEGQATERPIGEVIVLQNVTQFMELDSAKTNFIATISHEFKTPIASIEMSLQLLQDDRVGELNAEQGSLVGSIRDDLRRLLRITGELLDLTQVESGKIHLAILPSEVANIVQYALNATRVQAEQKSVKVQVTLQEGLPQVLADAEKTAWVVTNLISNAIRYSYEHATVMVAAKQVNGKVRIEIQDSGQGIAPQYQGKIFERYFRVPGSSKEGTGLGLAISKEFIEAQDGAIGMQSDFGAGSTFWVELQAERG
ncbi:MAG: ATP-binding protein [Bacteroidia bacterium]